MKVYNEYYFINGYGRFIYNNQSLLGGRRMSVEAAV